MPQERSRATKLIVEGRERSSDIAGKLGTALREARVAGGLTQRDLGERAHLAQTEVSRLERGFGGHTDLETWAVLGNAVGLRLATFFEGASGADLPRDIQHLRRQALVIDIAKRGGWQATPEFALPNDGPRPRSIDVLLTRPATRESAVIEVWDLLLDGGDAMRGLHAKVEATRRRHPPDWRVQGLLLLRRTARNKRLLAELATVFATRYPASSTAWLRALQEPHTPMPSADGFAWTDVDGTRLIPARLG